MTILEIVKEITEQKKFLVVRTGPLMFTMNSRALSHPAASTCTSCGDQAVEQEEGKCALVHYFSQY